MSDSLEITVEEAREIVLDVSRRKGWVRPELRDSQNPEHQEFVETLRCIREELGDAVETIARDIYSRQNRFILELIQNAEDCNFNRTRDIESISFEVTPGKIVVECNEDGFREVDVRQICHTGKSWKKDTPGYVGEKGIGFKSVFQVASRVLIQSNSFSFSFEYNGGERSEEKLGIITPIPEDGPIPPSQRPLTRMTLTLNDRTPYNDLVSHFTTIPETLLMFLSKLKEIRISIYFPDQRRTFFTTFRKSLEPAGITRLYKLSEASNRTDEWRYHVTKTPVSDLPNDPARPNINECEIVLAFPVDEHDLPRLSTQRDIFAFLPVCTVGFNFIIQADFILQASREEVIVDSAWNYAIIDHVAEAFCNAVLEFCESNYLRFLWTRFLPFGRVFDFNPLWKKLSIEVIKLLKQKNILYHHDASNLFREGPCQPRELRSLPTSYLDDNGSPLFPDRPGRNRKYLSLRYDPEAREVLKAAFHIRDIEDIHMFHRIKQDLDSPVSKTKDPATDAQWQSRAADLITSILQRSPEVKNMMKDRLDIIPLIDGRWVTGATAGIFFPARNGPPIPGDLVVTIDPELARNVSRRNMFKHLGAVECPPESVLGRLWISYIDHGGASTLAASKAHLSYLYWHYSNFDDARFLRLWIYDNNSNKVVSRRKIIYLRSEDEYGPWQLLKGVRDPRNPVRLVPECPVSYANAVYMERFSSSTPRHELSWLQWLKDILGVRCVPRLKYEAGSLSAEMRHIIMYRPDKIIGTLVTHWATYRREMTVAIEDEISRAVVRCRDGQVVVLSCTYFPLPGLIQKTQQLGIGRRFPFIAITGLSEEDGAFEDCRFLTRFGVKFDADLTFYLEILRRHEASRHQIWNNDTRNTIIKAYELIADHFSEINKATLLESFHRDNLILHPRAFQPSSTAASWLDVQNSSWRGPENLLDKTPLASVASYRTNRKVIRLFCDILGIRNTNWQDYLDMALKLRRAQNPPPDLLDKSRRLYELLSESRMSDEDWESVLHAFQSEALIYVSPDLGWFSPSQCLWTSPVPIQGKAIIGNLFADGLKPFFLERLMISPASLSTLVEGLCSISQGQPSVADAKQMIRAINAMNPEEGDLDLLVSCNILPIRGIPSGPAGIVLKDPRSNFVVTDREKLADIFRGHVGFLDFSLEEVRELDPFLQALKIRKKFLSCICMEETACSENGELDNMLRQDFKDRAYDLLRCVVSHRSPLVLGGSVSLYNRLLAVSILKTDSISTQYSIRHENGDVVGPITRNTGYVHIREHGHGWQIFVPRTRRTRDICYIKELPEALTKLFKIEGQAREIISYVLNSRLSLIDELLENAGIGRVPGVDPPPRRVVEDTDDESVVMDIEASAPQMAMRRRLSQTILSNREMGSVGTPGPSVASGAHPRISESSASQSPRVLGEADARASALSDDFPLRSPSSAYPEQNEFYSNNAYWQLLDNVIRIGGRTALSHRNILAGPANGGFHQGFDHEAAFGVRSQGQMNHDVKIGAAGELFVYECLLNLALPSFNWANWRSTIRKEVTIHPRYARMGAWPQRRETSDIVYDDIHSKLTHCLIQAGYLDEQTWAGTTPEYFIEVKTTTGECGDRFFVSKNQYNMMQEMALVEGRVSGKVYIICRVYNLGRENLNMKIFVDPEAHRGRDLAFEVQTWTVTPRP